MKLEGIHKAKVRMFFEMRFIICVILLFVGVGVTTAAPITFLNIEVTAIKDTSVVIRWDTDKAATGQIKYGVDISYGNLTEIEDLSYWHSMEITGLNEKTTYRYRIRAKDYDGNETMSDDYTFTTRTQEELEAIVKAARSGGDLPQEYYVSTSGSDDYNGKFPTYTGETDPETGKEIGPWTTPSYAAQIAETGDIIYLLDGTWDDEHIVFANSGIDVAPIVMKAYSGTPTLNGNSGCAFYTSSKSYFIVEGVRIEGYEFAFQFLYSGMGIRILNNTITGTSKMAIHLWNMGGTFSDIIISGNILTGIYIGGSSPYASAAIGGSVTNAVVKNNTIITTGTLVSAIDLSMFYSVVAENHIEHTGMHGVTSYKAQASVVRDNYIEDFQRGVRFDYFCGDEVPNMIIGNTIKNARGNSINLYERTQTIIDSNTMENGALHITGCSNTQFRNNIWKDCAISVEGGTEGPNENLTFTGDKFINSRYSGCDFHSLKNGKITNCVFVGKGWFTGFTHGESENVTVSNNVFYDVPGTAILVAYAKVTNLIIKNNIFMNVNGHCVDNQMGENVTVAYNDIWNCSSPTFNNITDTNTLIQDPLFADPANNDFHLKSQYGRWNGTTWVKDSITSPCIDAGDPSSDYSNEPASNGGRINIGTYGNTTEASKSYVPPEEEEKEKSETITVYPNPYIASKGKVQRVIFSGLPSEAAIRICTVTGELVKRIEHKNTTDGGNEEWDVSGIASGIYLYCIESSEGVKKGKVSIIK